MKQIITFFFLLWIVPLFGQDFKTGDAALDSELRTVNIDAQKNLSLFKTNVSAEFTIPVPKLDGLLKIMQPAEVLLSLRIAKIGNVSIETVTQCYKTNKSKGWGYIAKEMGIKPGSPEFHALKGNKKKSNPSSSGHGGSNGKPNGNGKH